MISGVCKFVFQMPNEIVFGRIIPGAALAILIGVCFYSWLAHRLAKEEQRTDVTALPYGISAPACWEPSAVSPWSSSASLQCP